MKYRRVFIRDRVVEGRTCEKSPSAPDLSVKGLHAAHATAHHLSCTCINKGSVSRRERCSPVITHSTDIYWVLCIGYTVFTSGIHQRTKKGQNCQLCRASVLRERRRGYTLNSKIKVMVHVRRWPVSWGRWSRVSIGGRKDGCFPRVVSMCLIGKMTFEERFEGHEGICHEDVRRKFILVRRNLQCKCTRAGSCLCVLGSEESGIWVMKRSSEPQPVPVGLEVVGRVLTLSGAVLSKRRNSTTSVFKEPLWVLCREQFKWASKAVG